METSSPIEWLSADDIQIPLSRKAGTDARLTGEWKVEQFKRGVGGGLGTWRLTGDMDTPAGPEEWSLVLKGWTCSEKSSSPSAFNWPWREADLYSSGVLNDLPAISAPACFHSVQRHDSVWVWLEDLTTLPQDSWTLEQYGDAALLLGRFNGAWLGTRSMPGHPSLSQQWFAGWTAEGAEGLRMINDYQEHPYVKRMIPPDVEAALVHTWHQRDALLQRLNAMPQTFCHLDAFHANTFFRDTGNGIDMVLIDWSFAGRAAVGEELAALCVAGVVFDAGTPHSLNEIEQVAFDAYIRGLRDAGWHGENGEVWNTYRSTAILRYGLSPLSKMLPIVTNEFALAAFAEAMGAPLDQAEEHLVRHYRWIADHAYEM